MANLRTPRSGSLLNSSARVEVPFVKVTIGGYTFGVYEPSNEVSSNGIKVQRNAIRYPNFVQSLKINKINGYVNEYELSIKYPISSNAVDPNFFEKIFSKVSTDRKIYLTYGDFSAPNYIYKDENAIITDVDSNFDIKNSIITYTVKAVSTAKLAASMASNFAAVTKKPSDVIKDILYDPGYNLTSIFTGMKDIDKFYDFVDGDDASISIPTITNVSPMDYISRLVAYMNPIGEDSHLSNSKESIYSLTTFDDINNEYGGPYFKIQKISKNINFLNALCTYSLDIGYPSSAAVMDFNLKTTDTWSIFYEYNKSISSGLAGDTVYRINDDGLLYKKTYSDLPKKSLEFTEYDKTWWNKVTGFPVEAEVTIKGLLRPAILMQYLKLNVLFFGNKHIASGYYIITSQVDTIDQNGYRTTLGLTRVAPDESPT